MDSYPDGKQMHDSYDGMGRVQGKTDGQGYSLSYSHDNMGRILRITGSYGEEKTYTYDVMGNVTAVTDAFENKTEYAYTFGAKLKAVKDIPTEVDETELTEEEKKFAKQFGLTEEQCKALLDIRKYLEEHSELGWEPQYLLLKVWVLS